MVRRRVERVHPLGRIPGHNPRVRLLAAKAEEAGPDGADIRMRNENKVRKQKADVEKELAETHDERTKGYKEALEWVLEEE